MTYPDLLVFLHFLPELKSTAYEEAVLKDVADVPAYALRREGEMARQWLDEGVAFAIDVPEYSAGMPLIVRCDDCRGKYVDGFKMVVFPREDWYAVPNKHLHALMAPRKHSLEPTGDVSELERRIRG